MRNKTFEVAMVIAIGAFTTLTVGSYIHDSQSGRESPVSKQLSTAFHRVGAWVQSRDGTPIQASINPDNLATVADPTSVAEQPSQNLLTQQDDTRLLKIAESLSSDMSTSDWTNVLQWLTNDDPATARTKLAELLDGKLSSSDRQWLATQFQGSRAFNQEDVTLLENAVKEVQQMLTPDELSLLRKQLAQLGVNIGQ